MAKKYLEEVKLSNSDKTFPWSKDAQEIDPEDAKEALAVFEASNDGASVVDNYLMWERDEESLKDGTSKKKGKKGVNGSLDSDAGTALSLSSSQNSKERERENGGEESKKKGKGNKKYGSGAGKKKGGPKPKVKKGKGGKKESGDGAKVKN